MTKLFHKFGKNPLAPYKLHLSLAEKHYGKNSLVLSCQALLDEALKSQIIWGYKMANTAEMKTYLKHLALVLNYMRSGAFREHSLMDFLKKSNANAVELTQLGNTCLEIIKAARSSLLVEGQYCEADLPENLANWQDAQIDALQRHISEIIQSIERFITGEQITIYIDESQTEALRKLVGNLQELLLEENATVGTFHPANTIIKVNGNDNFFSIRAQCQSGFVYVDCRTDLLLQKKSTSQPIPLLTLASELREALEARSSHLPEISF